MAAAAAAVLLSPGASAAPADPIRSVGVGGRPTGAVVSPDGALAYVSNPGESTIDIVDLRAAQLVQSIDVAAGVQPPVLNASGTRLYVTTQSDASLLIIDTAARSILGRVRVGSQPTMPVLSRSGAQLFIANTGSDDVSIVDVASGTVTRTVPVGDKPLPPVQGTGNQYSPLDSLLFVSNSGSATVSTIDLAAGQPVAEDAVVAASTRPAVSPFLGVVHDRLYIASSSAGTVTDLDQSRGGTSTTVRVGRSPGTPVSSIDGTALFVPNTGSGTLSVLDTAQERLRVSDTIPIGTGPTMPTLSPNGRILFVPDTAGTMVTVVDTNTRRVRGAYATESGPVNLALSPDGHTLIVPNSGSGTVSVIDLTAPALPAPPPSIAVKVRSGGAMATWTPSDEAGVTGYVVTAMPGGRTCMSRGDRCTVRGLTAGTRYRFSVQAINANGRSAPTFRFSRLPGRAAN